MKEKDVYAEISSIRTLMERSAKFISLSGLSGVLAGIYAIVGAGIGYKLVYGRYSGLPYRENYVNDPIIMLKLLFIAVTILVLSVTTGILFSVRKAKKKGQNIWNTGSKKLLTSLSIHLATGGFFILILMWRGDYGIIASACLVFYGLALIAGSHYTYTDVKWLGLCEISLGLLAALMPGYGIVFWTLGFGILHIVYGSIMYFKYDR